jgi:hypothetical protein
MEFTPLASSDLLKDVIQLDQGHPVRYDQPGRYTQQVLHSQEAHQATQPKYTVN